MTMDSVKNGLKLRILNVLLMQRKISLLTSQLTGAVLGKRIFLKPRNYLRRVQQEQQELGLGRQCLPIQVSWSIW